MQLYLQYLVQQWQAEQPLDPTWAHFDRATFGAKLRLWPYQQQALTNALQALWQFYRGGTPPPTDDLASQMAARRQRFAEHYANAGLNLDKLALPLDDSAAAKRRVADLLKAYYPLSDLPTRTRVTTQQIEYTHFLNRMSFWMATGSGKTLVIVKLIELLWRLMQAGEIPTGQVMVLAHRDDLLNQFRRHVHEFNRGATDLFFNVRDLRDYAQAMRTPPLDDGRECTVFCYRSDNLSDERKDKIINFRDYDNGGQWYVLLDEAHRGDKEDSKRQHIFSILARHGFLFNFSATFTDERDQATTVFNFNLSEFVRQGYGKHLCLLQAEARAFRPEDDYTAADKQKIVLKTLLMLTYTHLVAAQVHQRHPALYHRPLLMALVNSVNTEEADLKLLFRELARVGRDDIDPAVWASARAELLVELSARPEFIFEPDFHPDLDIAQLQNFTPEMVRRTVYHASRPGDIEVVTRLSDRKELAFKLKTAAEPFALIRIGDVADWLKQELVGYEISQHIEEDAFFARLNQPDSPINLLMGSRSFYEGWDSNRPNLILYINIGTGTDAKKFILQSVGRGVRVEPAPGLRRRWQELHLSGALAPWAQARGLEAQRLYDQVRPHTSTLESVFLFGANRAALHEVIQQLDQECHTSGTRQLTLPINHAEVAGRLLLIPTYQASGSLHQRQRTTKLALHPQAYAMLTGYLNHMAGADTVLLAQHGIRPSQLRHLRLALANGQAKDDPAGRQPRTLEALLRHALNYFDLPAHQVERIKPLEQEINHFLRIQVAIEAYDEVTSKVRTVLEAVEKQTSALRHLKEGAMTAEEYGETIRELPTRETLTVDGALLHLNGILRHYYLPALISGQDKIGFIRPVIRQESERVFIALLEKYQSKLRQACTWWLFSRVDEHLDDIYLPYYDPADNRIAHFKPDFIFWFLRAKKDGTMAYHIVFVDPKGFAHAGYQHKVDGFRALFEVHERPRVFVYDRLEVTVHLRLFAHKHDASGVGASYQRYWADNLPELFNFLRDDEETAEENKLQR